VGAPKADLGFPRPPGLEMVAGADTLPLPPPPTDAHGHEGHDGTFGKRVSWLVRAGGGLALRHHP
jgi:hypothetical protein